MNICIFAVSTLAHRMGGMEVQGQLLSKALADLGHQVTVLTTRHPDWRQDDVQADGVRLRFLPAAPPAVYSRHWWTASTQAFEQLCRKDDIDVVVSQSAAAFGVLDRLGGRPLIVNIYGVPGGAFWSEWRGVGSPWQAIRLAVVGVPEYLLNKRRWWGPLLRAAQAINVDSTQGRAALLREFRLPAERVHVLLNGLELEAYRPVLDARARVREGLGAGPEALVVLMVGTANRQKGLDIGLRAFAATARYSVPVKLWVVGDGPYLDFLRRLADDLGIHRAVTFLGQIPFDGIEQYFLGADIFLNPTRRNEGLPLVIISAMLAGNAIVSSNVGGIPSAIDHGVNGLLVPRADLKGFVAALDRVLTDPELAHRLGAEARRTAGELFDIKRTARRFLESVMPLVRSGG